MGTMEILFCIYSGNSRQTIVRAALAKMRLHHSVRFVYTLGLNGVSTVSNE